MATRSSEGKLRTRSMLSFGSRRSRNSAEGVSKMDLTETSKEKSHRRMTSKADPTKAMNEAQPGGSCSSPVHPHLALLLKSTD